MEHLLPTRILSIGTNDYDSPVLREAAAILREGGLVAFPTETVYGLGADATNPDAVAAIFRAKGRPATNPLIVHADDYAMARTCVREWPVPVAKLAERFWPGPLTIVLARSDRIAPNVSAGLDTVGLRIPGKRAARSLIRLAGVPIAAPSANRSTGISPTLASHVAKDLTGRIDLILDGGPTHVGIESTVLDLTGETPRILRPGVIAAQEIEEVLKAQVETAPGVVEDVESPMTSPGQMPLHYAPRTYTTRVPPSFARRIFLAGPRAGVLVLGRPGLKIENPRVALRIDLPTAEEAERNLYAALHQLDEAGLDTIVIVTPPKDHKWLAVYDRILRASRYSKQDWEE